MARRNNKLKRADQRKLEDHLFEQAETYDGQEADAIANASGNALGFTVTKANVVGAIDGLEIPITVAKAPRGGGPRVTTPQAMSTRISRLRADYQNLLSQHEELKERVRVLEDHLTGGEEGSLFASS